MLKINKKKLFNACEYLMVISLILHCRTMWSYIPEIRDIFSFLSVFLLIMGVLGCVLFGRIRNSKGKLSNWTIYILIYTMYFLIYYIGTMYNFPGVARMLICCLALLTYIYLFMGREYPLNLLIKLKNMLYVIAIVSIFLWIVGSQLSVIKPLNMVYSDWSNKFVNNYLYFYFEPQTIFSLFGNNILVRNSAIFTEAPMCSLAFCTGLLIELYLCKNKSWKHLAAFSVGILSTFSGAGYIIMILAYYTYFLTIRKKGRTFVIIKIILGLLSFMIIFAINFLLVNKLNSISGSIRLDDFIAGLKAWKMNIIFGNGLYNLDAIQYYMSSWRSYNRGFSNSLMQILSDGGIYLSIFYGVCTINGIKSTIKNKDVYAFLFIILFLIMFIFTISSYINLILYVFIMMAFGCISSNSNT